MNAKTEEPTYLIPDLADRIVAGLMEHLNNTSGDKVVRELELLNEKGKKYELPDKGLIKDSLELDLLRALSVSYAYPVSSSSIAALRIITYIVPSLREEIIKCEFPPLLAGAIARTALPKYFRNEKHEDLFSE